MTQTHGSLSSTVALPEDAADRRRAAESIDESLVVEAGAGTGKTTLLIARIVNLLRRALVTEPPHPPRPVRMSEIAAITFTEKAAGELKVRLRDVLDTAVATGQFRADPLTEHERQLLAAASEEIDRAVVSTIHSFCAGMIRERPVEAGVDPGRTTADALTLSLLFDEAWERWRSRAFEIRDDAVLAAALRAEVKADRSSPEDRSLNLRDLAATLVANRDLLEFLPAPIDEAAAWSKWKSTLEKQAADIAGCLKYLKDADKFDNPAGIATKFLEAWGTVRSATLDEARSALVLTLKLPAHTPGAKYRWNDLAQRERLCSLLTDLRERLLPDARAALTHNMAVALAERMTNFVDAYTQLKEDRGLFDFQDLLIIARNMLAESTEARDYFRERFRYLLIDEFQDTDPLQTQVALLLSGEPDHRSPVTDHQPLAPGRLFLVGDPKQSIYRFRRADIEVYDQCTARLGDDHHVRIRQNFRSGSRIIAWVNRVFTRLIERSSGGHYQPQYVPLIPGPRAARLPGDVVLLYPPEPSRDCAGNIDNIRFREGCCIALFIQQAVADEWPCRTGDRDRPLTFGDVAILLPRTTGIEHYEEAFRACELPYHIIGGKHFYRRLEIQSLTNVVTAIDNPEDGIAVVGALRSPFFGCSDEDLLRHALAGGQFNYLRPKAAPVEPLAEIFELFRRLHRDRNSRTTASLLSEFFDETKGLELFLTKPQGAVRVANLLKVVDAARSMERTGVLTFRGFARWLSERQTARDDESESLLAEPGDPSVQVLTVHKAKGLEFAMTVVANLNTGAARSSSRAAERIIFDRVHQSLHLGWGHMTTAGWREAQEWDAPRVEAERRRLFYVAATRARDYLVLPVFWRKDDRAGGIQNYLENTLDMLPTPDEVKFGERLGEMVVHDTRQLPQWPEAQHMPQLKLDDLTGSGAATGGDSAVSSRATEEFLVARTEWQRDRDRLVAAASAGRPIVRASDSVTATRPEPPPADPDEPPECAGPEFGTLVHRLIELQLGRRFDEKQLATAATRLAAELGLTTSAAQSALDLVRQANESPLVRRLRAARRVFFEVPFTFADGGQLTEGRIDAVAEEPAGLLIVDFKTDRVAAGGEAALAEHYAPQLNAYARAVATATARPVIDAILFFLRTRRAVSVSLAESAALAESVALRGEGFVPSPTRQTPHPDPLP